MNRNLQKAFAGCANVEVVSLGTFLHPLLSRDLDALARLPGKPATVLAAQFLYYARTSTHLAECMALDRQAYSRIAAAIVKLDETAKQKSILIRASTSAPQEPPHGPHLPLRKKGCAGCPTACH